MSIVNKCKQSFSHMLLVAAGMVFAAQSQALDLTLEWDELEDVGETFVSKQFSEDMKIRGWAIAEDVYFGQAKVAGEYGLGIVVDKGDVSWGLNHRGVAVTKKF